MADYRGFVPGPSGEMLAPTVVTPEALAAGRAAEAARINRAVAARLEQEASARATLERIDAERGARELEAYHARARAAWLGSGGTASEFNDAWPELKRRHLTAQTVEGLTATDRLVEREASALRASGRYSRM